MFIVKIDLEKAYDETDWKFLDFIFERKGFGPKWRSWIPGYLSSDHFSIIMNGTPKGFFQASQGLRQGDAVSPFLFTLAIDSLSQIIIMAESKGLFRGFQVGSHKVKVSQLLWFL